MFELFDKESTSSHKVNNYPYDLLWIEKLGIGFLKSDGYSYDKDYWETYLEYAHSKIGTELTRQRAEFVTRNGVNFSELCDIGVGSGQFVDTVKCKGMDINPYANTWLKEHNYYADRPENFSSLTLWDVIEHIDDPRALLKNTETVFISTPIYKDLSSCLLSKHFKPREHIWYFTDSGVKYFMEQLGFIVKDESNFETVLGREGIMSYCFVRTNKE